MKRKLIAATLVAAMILVMVPGLAAWGAEGERHGHGYWRRWLPAGPFTAGGITHTHTELLGLLKAGGSQPDSILSPHLAAAFLNLWNNQAMPSLVMTAFDQASSYLADPVGSTATREDVLGWKDILEQWNENQIEQEEPPPPVVQPTTLLSVDYVGTSCTFGSHAGDTLTLIFSDDVQLVGTSQAVHFQTAGSLGTAVPEWTIDGKVLAITAPVPFANPRPRIGDFVTALDGIEDLAGNPVVVPDGGVRVDGEECEKAVLLSVVLVSAGGAFGSHPDDTLILTFSHDIYLVGAQRLLLPGGDSIGNALPTWEKDSTDGRVLTITASATFSRPRPEVGGYVIGIEGVVNECGCAATVPDGGVEVTGPQ